MVLNYGAACVGDKARATFCKGTKNALTLSETNLYIMKRITILAAALLVSLGLCAQTYTADWESLDEREVPEWFENAKFGIFIHWGLYSVPSYSPSAVDGVQKYDRYAEHYWNRMVNGKPSDRKFFGDFHNRTYGPNFEYRDFASMFKAEMFQPEEWARIFEDSGARYVVLTSKHHEGYCLWPSKYSPNWNAVDTGPHRDLLGDLTDAVRARGLKMGYYYSLLEWFHPLYTPETLDSYIDQHEFPQMKELVESYRPDILWTDGEWDYTSARWRSVEFIQWLYNESSVRGTVAINDRWGSETRSLHGGYYTTEYDLVHSGDANGMAFKKPWEECRGIGGSFGFNRHEYLDEYSTSEQLVHILINKVARGGNLLLNIGPTADGRIPVIMQQRLRDIGDWLRVNGEAIYDTRKWDKAPAVTPDTKTFFTVKDGALYVIVTEWTGAPVVVGGVKGAKAVSMLGTDARVRFSQSGGKLTIMPPVLKRPTDIPCNYAWVYKVEFR